MDKPPELSLGSMHLDIASAFYAGKPEISTTAAALSRALGPAQTLPRLQPSLQNLQSPLLLWPPVIWPALAAVKHPMPLPPPPPAKKLKVLQTSSVLTPALPDMEALPVVKLPLQKLPVRRPLPKLQVRRPLPNLQMHNPLQQASLVLEQGSLKQEVLVTPLTSATPVNLYCECFSIGRYCKGCSCTNCYNNGSHENARSRQDAINVVLECRPMAFTPKVESRSCSKQSSETLLSFPTSPPVNDDKGLISERDTKAPSKLGHHEVTYRSVLADIIQMEDVNELCKLLILASRQPAKAFLDSGITEDTSSNKLDQAESCLSTNSDKVVQKEQDIHAYSPESRSYERNDTDRPVSPGSQNLPDIFIEQERRVLANFRDCLCKLANCGRVQGEKLSSMSTKSHKQTSNNSINSSSITRVGEVSRLRQAITPFSI
ncbi:unnamed protein product [Urochloa humidicola]